MKENLTDVTVILDRSGSMTLLADDTIGGFNEFLRTQRDDPGETLMSLVTFNHQVTPVFTARPVKEAEDLSRQQYIPAGNTALLDAIGKTIDDTGKRLAAMKEEDRPRKVVMVIMTDGIENSSRTYTYDHIAEMIQHQQEKYNWQFLFLGANQDAIATASGFGIAPMAAMDYGANSKGTRSAFISTSSTISAYKSGDVTDVFYGATDRQAQAEAGVKSSNS